MNELRWILLGIGALVIAGIYVFDALKQKRNIRSRVEKYPGFNHNGISSLNINPKKEKNIDITGALEAFNSYLRQAKSGSVKDSKHHLQGGIEPKVNKEVATGEVEPPSSKYTSEQQIMVIYITAQSVPRFYGNDILEAMKIADMQYGDMKIFHYHGPDKKHSSRALFSIANIHEPGIFDLDNMESFVTDGLAMFMCLPAEIGGDIAFEIMHDTAQTLAHQLGGELQAIDRHPLNNESLNKMREIASKY